MEKYNGTVLLDLDRCGIGEIMINSPQLEEIPQDEKRFGVRPASISRLAILRELGLDVHFLTHRPPAQVFLLGHLFGAYHLTESGLSAVVWGEEQSRIQPLCCPSCDWVFRKHWCDIAFVADSLVAQWPGAYPQFGDRWFTRCYINPHDPENLCEAIKETINEGFSASITNRVEIKSSYGVVDITPSGWSKRQGIEWAFWLHGELYDYALYDLPLLYLDDSGDEATVACVTKKGGAVGCPSNATDEFKGIVRKYGGVVATQPYELGCLEIIRDWHGSGLLD